MNISSSDFHVTISFETPDALWSLLVIDDKWDSVKAMICGEQDPITRTYQAGLLTKCIDKTAVEDLWKNRYPSEETFERTLWLLPWMVAGIEGYDAITFCGFPGNEERFKRLLELFQNTEKGNHIIGEQCVVLIDVYDAAIKKERFLETWDILDKFEYPSYARAKLTRGGIELPPWVDHVASIGKEPPTGGVEALKQNVQKWLSRVRGLISSDLYQSLTERSCHNPTDLIDASYATRKEICCTLAKDDLYGVWRWCADEALCDPLPKIAPHRWLASKAFQTTPINNVEVPLTAVIAVCEGARNLASLKSWAYTVDSGIYQIPPEEVGVRREKLQINKLKALGCIMLAQGNYGDFAAALRQWLIHPEQFIESNSRIEHIQIQTDDGAREAYIRLTYSGELPETIFNSALGVRRGRVGRSWQRLARFASNYIHNGNQITLIFSWER